MPQENADIVAYMLQVNKIPAGSADLPTDAAALKMITITKAKLDVHGAGAAEARFRGGPADREGRC